MGPLSRSDELSGQDSIAPVSRQMDEYRGKTDRSLRALDEMNTQIVWELGMGALLLDCRPIFLQLWPSGVQGFRLNCAKSLWERIECACRGRGVTGNEPRLDPALPTIVEDC